MMTLSWSLGNALRRAVFRRRRRADSPHRDAELDRIREQMLTDAALLRAEETALDTRASIVVVAGGVIVAANAGLSTALSLAFLVAVIGAVTAVLLAVLSLALSPHIEKQPVYSIRPWQMNDRAEYTATIMDQIHTSQRSARRRRAVLTAAYVSTGVGTVGLALNTVLSVT